MSSHKFFKKIVFIFILNFTLSSISSPAIFAKAKTVTASYVIGSKVFKRGLNKNSKLYNKKISTTKKGYSFNGWYNSSFSKKYSKNYKVGGNIKVYAVYKDNVGDGKISITAKKKGTVMSILKWYGYKLDITYYSEYKSYFLNSIDGKKPPSNKYWALSGKGVDSLKGISQTVKKGSTIVFSIKTF